jgi:hypothetical protein
VVGHILPAVLDDQRRAVASRQHPEDGRLRLQRAEAELPFARTEGNAELAGTYVGLVPGYIRMDLAGQFLGGSGAWLYSEGEGKTALLSCDCGEVGCSPLLARVTVSDDTVT